MSLAEACLKPLQKAHETLTQAIKGPVPMMRICLTLVEQHSLQVVRC